MMNHKTTKAAFRNWSKFIVFAFLLANYYVSYSQIRYADLQKKKQKPGNTIENVAAKEFHRLLNEYRISQNLDTLQWSDVLWLASYNHTVWMVHTDTLRHIESKGNRLFTGEWPSERIDFVMQTEQSCSYTAENILYNYTARRIDSLAWARVIAKQSFKQWQNSPDHNKNMLNIKSSFHGIAFIMGTDDKIWSTSLFASYQANKIKP